MATSLISTGVQFADSTIQTTAAVAGGGSAEIVASGSLSNGSTVIVNADGTVSVVSGVIGGAGSPVVFNGANLNIFPTASAYDSTNGKVVIAYTNTANSNYGTAIVGTVSGTSITFGTAVVFRSAQVSAQSASYDLSANRVVIGFVNNTGVATVVVGTVSGTSISFGSPVAAGPGTGDNWVSLSYDSVNQKTIVAYQTTSSIYGTARVGTVSGTSISFGTAATFASSNTSNISSAYDSANNKVVMVYRNNSNSGYGTAVVGTVSGTTISFGTPVVFESASAFPSYGSTAYDISNGKIIIVYSDNGNSDYGTAVVGTVSGTSISFGTPVVFESANSGIGLVTYDASTAKVVIEYSDNGNSGFGTFIVGTVSGTSISFETPVVFNSAGTGSPSSTYDSINQKVVTSYRNVGNSGFGTSIVFQTGYSNLTSENFIGISDAAYTNGQTATIQLTGAVDDAQTGLTAGKAYYVQSDGTLGLTPVSPSVFAGTAVSSTKLIIKG